jgi:hypothetical protein
MTNRLFGVLPETESSWSDALSDAHARYIFSYREQEQQRQEAVLAEFLAAKER